MGFMKHYFSLNPLEGNYVFDVVDQAISICHQNLTFYQQDVMPFHLCLIYFVFLFLTFFSIFVVLSPFPMQGALYKLVNTFHQQSILVILRLS
jgi:hypothetical protein